MPRPVPRRLTAARQLTGGSIRRQIAAGAEVTSSNQGRHIIRNRQGAIVETNVYGSGPYPPVRRSE
jgi:hypothetical protein